MNGELPHPRRQLLQQQQRRWKLRVILVILIIISTVYVYIIGSFYRRTIMNDNSIQENYTWFQSMMLGSYNNNNNNEASHSATSKAAAAADTDTVPSHRVAGLSCDIYGGPTSQDAINEMIYWYDIPSDTQHYISPYGTTTTSSINAKTTAKTNTNSNSIINKDSPKYLTFEPDEGGWNNIRMAMETTIAMAISMGRILVLPPDMTYYLLWNDQNSSMTADIGINMNNVLNFHHFYHLQSIQDEYNTTLQIITFQEFLIREAITGQLYNRTTGKVSFPPEKNRTDWFGTMLNFQSTRGGRSKLLWEWIRQVTQPLDWSMDHCVAVFPSEAGIDAVQRQQTYIQQVLDNDQLKYGNAVRNNNHKYKHSQMVQLRVDSYRNHPTPVNASVVDRLAEILVNRKQLCIYNTTLQQSKVLHITGSSTYRFLIHFYAFLFYENYHTDLYIKRFIRDHFRYLDVIQCAAARIIEKIRTIAKSYNSTNVLGHYDSFHIRRGDFQYDVMYLSANEIYETTTKDIVPDGRTVYIATDETNRTFFDKLHQHYNLLFLSDFTDLISDISPNYYGMIDQLVASKGEVFVGTYYSTFTGYINRLRGYHAQKLKLDGYENGRINSYYYVPESHERYRTIMQSYHSVQRPIWSQEFPVCWRDINHDIEDTIL